jgi:NAD(P)-dependent dehydrogenase (short-subunit alcohol dehydrogenase family)
MSVVLITGSSSGIGHATAIYLAKKGHKVYATMRDPSKAPQPYILDGELLPIDVVQMDVNNDVSVEKAIKQVLDKEGRIDVLVNNAGISALGAIEELPLESFKKDMETNYFGTVRCIQAVLPSMRQRKKGTIINISSVAGKVYSNFHGTYAPTKAAVEALSECLAQEVVPHGIRVAVVEPGVTETPIFSKAYQLPEKTNYPNIKRFLSIFAASLENHAPPDGVAKVILDIIEGRSTTFRNPAGPDAIPLIEWRASQKDEDWIASTSIDDETWTSAMEEGMNLHVRTYMNDPSLINFPTQNKVVL